MGSGAGISAVVGVFSGMGVYTAGGLEFSWRFCVNDGVSEVTGDGVELAGGRVGEDSEEVDGVVGAERGEGKGSLTIRVSLCD